MPGLLVPTLKFVGTVSLGLLTGISYSQSLLTAPSLLKLSDATSAHEASTSLRALTRLHGSALLFTSITSYTLAYVFSPPRGGKHPYLLWTSLVAATGAGVSAYLHHSHGLSQASSASSTSATTQRQHIDGDDDDYIDATHSTATLTPTSSDAGFGLHDDNAGVSTTSTTRISATSTSSSSAHVNGEQIRRGLEAFGTVEGIRAGITGLAFFMGVVGIWGDGHGVRRAV